MASRIYFIRFTLENVLSELLISIGPSSISVDGSLAVLIGCMSISSPFLDAIKERCYFIRMIRCYQKCIPLMFAKMFGLKCRFNKHFSFVAVVLRS